MAYEALKRAHDSSSAERKPLTMRMDGELPAVDKWPKRWRFAFILGTALLTWGCVAIALRLV